MVFFKERDQEKDQDLKQELTYRRVIHTDTQNKN